MLTFPQYSPGTHLNFRPTCVCIYVYLNFMFLSLFYHSSMTFFVYIFPSGLRRQLRHAPNHISIPLQKVRLLEIFKVNIRQITTQVICLDLLMCSMFLRLVVVVARLSLVVIGWDGSYKRITLLEPTIHPVRLVPLIIKVTMLH